MWRMWRMWHLLHLLLLQRQAASKAYVAMVAMVAYATPGFNSATSGDGGICNVRLHHLTNIYTISQAMAHQYSSVKLC